MSIKIREPRYRDNKVLLARYRLPVGQDVDVEILYGARKGLYRVSNEDICNSPIEYMTTKTGKRISMRVVPLEKLERVE